MPGVCGVAASSASPRITGARPCLRSQDGEAPSKAGTLTDVAVGRIARDACRDPRIVGPGAREGIST